MPQGRRDIADLVKRCVTLERERDEARQWARVMLTERNDWRHEAERLCAERDEALAVCTELAERGDYLARQVAELEKARGKLANALDLCHVERNKWYRELLIERQLVDRLDAEVQQALSEVKALKAEQVPTEPAG